VLRRFDQERLTLVELTLETGRTHQIRVHFSEMNHPVIGDPVYGSSGRVQALTDPELRKRLLSLHRQALHARVLGFIHPATAPRNSKVRCRRTLGDSRLSRNQIRPKAKG
jgi:23S rRNA pseudouridine1911/1915/1917 synthase